MRDIKVVIAQIDMELILFFQNTSKLLSCEVTRYFESIIYVCMCIFLYVQIYY